MRTRFIKTLTILACCGFAVCQSKNLQSHADSEPPALLSRPQELNLTTEPFIDQPPYGFHRSWARISQNNKRYRLALAKDFSISNPRPFQFGGFERYFAIVIDKQLQDGGCYKLLAMYATDHKRWNYRPYWITCNHDLSRTKLYGSNIGVVAVEFLKGGGYRVSALGWDEQVKTFACKDVAYTSLSFP